MGGRRGKRWNSCLLWFAASLGAFCLSLPGLRAEGNAQREEINYPASQGDTITSHELEASRKLIYVSTLDGKLSALDVRGEGELLWSIPADNRPLLSSSISQLEIMENGVSTRYIPSLDGGLYRYDGESIHPVPLSADKLLSATHKLSEDTMMVGGKDLLSYGLNPQTGQVRYACGVKGCRTFGDQIGKDEDILVVTRQTQTVRAVDSRSGSEKWNYSVGQHEVSFMQGQIKDIEDYTDDSSENDEVSCSLDDEDDIYETMESFSNTVKIVVPEGMVVGVSPDNLQTVNWTYKFKSPISNVWLLYHGELRQIDLFDNMNIPALSSFTQDSPLHQPLLYIGLHNKQLYVQQSEQMRDKMTEAAATFKEKNIPASCNSPNLPRVAWKPYLNTAQWRTPTMNNQPPQIEDGSGHGDMGNCDAKEDSGALVIWHENYPFDNGFYLYPEFSISVPVSDVNEDYCERTGTCEGNQSQESTIYDDVLAMPVTLWNWWKEVIAISVVTSVLVHILLSRFHKPLSLTSQNSTSNQSLSESGSVSNLSVKDGENENLPPSRQNSDEYISRYATDYEHIQVLGKGGFGVVFEAANKVDECHYAIKRIALPNSDGAKEKVMREVKALAKLDHVGIVRYFHTWIESPPPGWQEDLDMKLEYSEGVTSPTFSPYTSGAPSIASGTPPKFDLSFSNSKPIKPIKNYSPKLKPSPLDFLKNPLGGNPFEMSEAELKRGSSEEFSVHNITESGWGNDEDESGSFSGMGTPNLPGLIDNSVDISFRHEDESESFSNAVNMNSNNSKDFLNIPFSDKEVSSSDFEQSDHIVPIDESNNSFQILFEDSGCGDKSSKGSIEDVCIGIQSSQSGIHDSHNFNADVENKCLCPKTHKRTNSKTHSRTHSRSRSLGQTCDFANFTIEKETKDKKVDKNESEQISISGHRPKLFLYIQMQLCKRETLKDWLASNTLNRDRHTVLDMFDQITSAIEYVHDCGLMHRDLKPSNIFFSVDGVIKMGDFGLVTALPEEQNEGFNAGNPFKKHTAQVGTQLYMSPEQTSGKKYSAKVDIFSLGVILFELLYPFATQMERVNTLVKVKQQVLPERFNREMSKESHFVSWLLSPKPEDRPSAKEILASELLHEFESRRMPRRFRSRTVSQNST